MATPALAVQPEVQPASGFSLHNIGHASASQVNLFAAQPALYVMERLIGKRGKMGVAAHRGTAAEAGIELGLFDPKASVEACVKRAEETFDKLTALSGDPNRQKERDALPGLVEQGLAELRQYGVPEPAPDGRQHKVSIDLPDVPVPVIGYIDFLFPQHGIIVDLKTQLRLSSSISEPHARQGSVYWKAHGNFDMRFAYVTPKKVGVYRLEDSASHLEAVRQILLRMDRFLSLSADPWELSSYLVPDYGSFFWNDPTTRQLGREVYGF